jgi:PAS domain S-box-containing protein
MLSELEFLYPPVHLRSHTSPSRSRPNLPIEPWQIEGREWWLWGFAVTVTLVLTAAIVCLSFFGEHAPANSSYWVDLREWVRGLAALVLLFDIYTMYQHLQLQKVRRQLAQREELFQLITKNAADMIAVVDSQGNRLYNSPAYQKILGYSAEELSSGSSLEQVHEADRVRVLEAAEKARTTGRGERLEYRMRHKDGSWRVLESTASPIRNAGGDICGLVIVNRDITDRKRAEELLEHSAFHDRLTNLPNRALFTDRLQHALLRARRHSDYKFAVLFIDVDEFKVINDSLGHAAGDQMLVQIATRLSVNFREADTLARSGTVVSEIEDAVARLGGDEFALLLEDAGNPSDAVRVAQRIQEKFAIPFDIEGHKLAITASVGVTCSDRSYFEAEQLLRDSEIAMYRAKRGGKARCQVFDAAMHSTAVRRMKLESDLRIGIERNELKVYYQPIISLASGRIVGFEALSRWQRADGLVSPAEFIPVADETGLILPINRALMVEACRQLKTWQSQFACQPPLTMSVNITPKQFVQAELPHEIATTLTEAGVAPGALQLEITENIAMSDADRALMMLSDLHALGVRLSLDDFGTGYSSLSRLPRFPIDCLKIDRAFIANMNTDHESHEIVRLIIMLAHSIGLKVVAEGTENEQQISELRRLGCDLAQGYFYSPPVSHEAALELMLDSYDPVSHS